MPKAQETILEIDLKSLKHNFDYLKSKLQSNTKILAVVKAFAYGSDAVKIAKHLETLNVNYFAVAYINEGITLRKAGVKTPILVLHPLAINFKKLIKFNLEPSLYSSKILNEFITIASTLKQTDTLKITSIFSHLASSEDLNEKTFTQTQIKTFKTIATTMANTIGYKPMLHICNTSGILNYPEAHFNMVRSGIGLYGFGNSKTENNNFKPISTLKTIISQIHHIEKGETVGYNRTFKSDSFLKTATLPIGHADGIARQYGNDNGYVIINNTKSPIIGNICMDMIMVDITNIDCKEGDEVIIFGQENTAENLAETTQTITYELITAISQRVKRKYLK